MAPRYTISNINVILKYVFIFNHSYEFDLKLILYA